MDDVPRWVKGLVVGFGLLLAAVIVAGSVCHSSGPKWEAAPEDPTPAPAPPGVPASDLSKIRAWRPGLVCTCGFVQSTSSAEINTVYVSSSSDWNRDDKATPTVVCFWKNYGPHGNWRQAVNSPICVRGEYQAPMIKDCSVVDKCPW